MELIAHPNDGATLDARKTMYPSLLSVVTSSRTVGGDTSTCYGLVRRGKLRLVATGLELRADEGAFFGMPGTLELGVDGEVVVIERLGFRGLPMAGRIEDVGRLSYIDGCSDTVLVAPPRLGDPVLNHLHFPPGTDQTVHSHPSIRLGVVARGLGVAFGPGPRGSRGWERPLEPGAVFLLNAHEMHAFRTADQSLDIIAFHPDSDWGPTDGAHPMLNRTYLQPTRPPPP